MTKAEDVARALDDAAVATYVSPDRLAHCPSRSFRNYLIYAAIDGVKHDEWQLDYVELAAGYYPRHLHRGSDAYFIFLSGHATMSHGDTEVSVGVGTRVSVPRTVPHGFEVDGFVTFLVIQSPPIRDPVTLEEDFETLTDQQEIDRGAK